jgi:5-methylcytosine-specific restriction endonuclease McrA
VSAVADYYAPLDPDVLRRERARARELRASGWWKRRIADGVCYYCRRRVGTGHLTMDHLVPLARGGRSIRGNVVPACAECNVQKKTRLPVEWAEYLDMLRAAADE